MSYNYAIYRVSVILDIYSHCGIYHCGGVHVFIFVECCVAYSGLLLMF